MQRSCNGGHFFLPCVCCSHGYSRTIPCSTWNNESLVTGIGVPINSGVKVGRCSTWNITSRHRSLAGSIRIQAHRSIFQKYAHIYSFMWCYRVYDKLGLFHRGLILRRHVEQRCRLSQTRRWGHQAYSQFAACSSKSVLWRWIRAIQHQYHIEESKMKLFHVEQSSLPLEW